MNRCILAGNVADNASPDLFRTTATFKAVGNNFIGNNGQGLAGTAASNFPAGALVGTPAAPRAARLRPIGPGGGQTFALAPLSDRPALNNASTSPLSTDQHGFPRGVGGLPISARSSVGRS